MDHWIKWNVCAAAMRLLFSFPSFTSYLLVRYLFKVGILVLYIWNNHLTGILALLMQVAVKLQLSQIVRSACPQHCKYLINLLIKHSTPYKEAVEIHPDLCYLWCKFSWRYTLRYTRKHALGVKIYTWFLIYNISVVLQERMFSKAFSPPWRDKSLDF